MILPEFLQKLIEPYLNVLQYWFSQKVYESVLARNSGHLLVWLSQHLDLSVLEQQCSGYYHPSGAGAKPTHGVERLLRAMLIKRLNRYSYRQTESEVHNNLLLRWFCGYGLFEGIFDHTTLERFEVWMCAQQHRSLFDEVLRQIDEDFPQERQAVQIGDTFAMCANAAQENLVGLLRHTASCLLVDLERENQELYWRVVGGLDFSGLLGVPGESDEYYLQPAERQVRIEQTVFAILELKRRVRTGGEINPNGRVQMRLEDLEKILRDEVILHTDAADQGMSVELLPANQRGSYRLGSATDPEASYRRHGERLNLGFNVSVAATPNDFIREIQAATGAQPDQAGVPALVEEQLIHHGVCPPKLIYDQAAAAGKTRAGVAQVSHGQTQLVSPLNTAPPDRFSLNDFRLSDDHLSLTCPNGVTTTSRYRATANNGYNFCFTARKCRDCPFWERCRSPKAKPTSERHLFVSDYLEEIQAAQAYNQTPAFHQDMHLRPRIERIIFMLTHYDDARYARGRGVDQADFQAKLAATARNLRTWMKLITQGGKIPIPST